MRGYPPNEDGFYGFSIGKWEIRTIPRRLLARLVSDSAKAVQSMKLLATFSMFTPTAISTSPKYQTNTNMS